MHAVEHLCHLFLVSLVHRPDCRAETRVRIDNLRENIIAILAIQCIPVLRALQFHGRADIACPQFSHLRAVLACHGIKLGNPFFRPRCHIYQVVTFPHYAGHHLEIIDVAQVLFYGCAENESRGRGFHLIWHQLPVWKMPPAPHSPKTP